MDNLYERQYRRIVELSALPEGSDSLFETGGTNVRVVRSGTGATAFELIAAPSGGTASERELDSEVRDGWVWVCIDLCT